MIKDVAFPGDEWKPTYRSINKGRWSGRSGVPRWSARTIKFGQAPNPAKPEPNRPDLLSFEVTLSATESSDEPLR